MNNYYFTFGVRQPYHHKYVKVIANNMAQARAMMVSAHGLKWAFPYKEDDFQAMQSRWPYTELAVLDRNDEAVDWEDLNVGS